MARINLIETGRRMKPKPPRKRNRFYRRETLDVIQKAWEEAGCILVEKASRSWAK